MLLLLLCAALACAEDDLSILDRLPLSDETQTQWSLPSRLAEVSALATTADGRLLTIDDERAIVYQVDYVDGGLVKAFALGNPVLRADFEGLAAVGDTVYLLTSDGVLYAAVEGVDGERVRFEKFDTGLGDQCEFEGLAEDLKRNRLLLLCKDVKRGADIDELAIFAWDLRSRSAEVEDRIELPFEDISRQLRSRHLHPSGIVLSAETDTLLIVAAREQALVELTADGELLRAIMLPLARRHPQAEGIAIGGSGQLIRADEGRNGRARLAVYAPDR
jgi:uncharacterized protein YjiK